MHLHENEREQTAKIHHLQKIFLLAPNFPITHVLGITRHLLLTNCFLLFTALQYINESVPKHNSIVFKLKKSKGRANVYIFFSAENFNLIDFSKLSKRCMNMCLDSVFKFFSKKGGDVGS